MWPLSYYLVRISDFLIFQETFSDYPVYVDSMSHYPPFYFNYCPTTPENKVVPRLHSCLSRNSSTVGSTRQQDFYSHSLRHPFPTILLSLRSLSDPVTLSSTRPLRFVKPYRHRVRSPLDSPYVTDPVNHGTSHDYSNLKEKNPLHLGYFLKSIPPS